MQTSWPRLTPRHRSSSNNPRRTPSAPCASKLMAARCVPRSVRDHCNWPRRPDEVAVVVTARARPICWRTPLPWVGNAFFFCDGSAADASGPSRTGVACGARPAPRATEAVDLRALPRLGSNGSIRFAVETSGAGASPPPPPPPQAATSSAKPATHTRRIDCRNFMATSS